jgi:hypothetical protein
LSRGILQSLQRRHTYGVPTAERLRENGNDQPKRRQC